MIGVALAALVAVLPPPEFDHKPVIPPDYQYIRVEAMQLICFREPGAPLVYSCSRTDRLATCHVYLPDLIAPGWAGPQGRPVDEDDVAMLERHEDGHCNRWPANHPGARNAAGQFILPGGRPQ